MTLAARLGSGFIARSESSSLTEDDIAAAASAMSIADGDGDGDRGCTADETGDCTVREQWTVQIEAKLKKRSTMRFDRARRQVESFLRDNHVSLPLSSCLSTFDGSTFDAFAPDNLKYIRICEARGVNGEILVDDIVPLSACVLDIHVFQDVTPAAAASEDPDQGDQQTDASRHWDLPCAELDGQWERSVSKRDLEQSEVGINDRHTACLSLVFDESLPLRLLDFVYSSLLFSDRGVDTNLVNISRVILLHGPPGTGKTTLCRALAQKLAIRLSDRFSFGKLVEVNSQSLFSKFFAESGKLVVQLFQSLHDLLDDQDVFVCVLIGRSGAL
nr:Pachytene checkpoint protein 2 [Polyrhizophydium stewartii]